jgi:hypothetical protein
MNLPRRKSNNTLVALTVTAVAGIAVFYPLWFVKSGSKPSFQDKALSPNLVIRGNYINTGSKDIGSTTVGRPK